MLSDSKILLVGCGKMGSALLSGWLSCGLKEESIIIVSPIACSEFEVLVAPDVSRVPEDFKPDIIVFAVKPDLMEEVCGEYKKYADTGSVFVSVAAGKDITFLENNLGNNTPIVRVMPNLPAMVSRGISVGYANNHVDDISRQTVEKLFKAVGSFYWLDDEGMMDAVTAISGSGPAYLFYFIEALEQAAIKVGLPEDLARNLAYDTVIGSADMVHKLGVPASELRKNVTSKGGTTQAALDVLMGEQGLERLLCDAAKAARDRSTELK